MSLHKRQAPSDEVKTRTYEGEIPISLLYRLMSYLVAMYWLPLYPLPKINKINTKTSTRYERYIQINYIGDFDKSSVFIETKFGKLCFVF